jgi:hypothetical protein
LEAEAFRGAVSSVRADAVPRTGAAIQHGACAHAEDIHERTLWPEFLALSEELDAHLTELTDRVIREAIDEDVSEAAEGEPAKALTAASGEVATDQPASGAGGENFGSEERSPT